MKFTETLQAGRILGVALCLVAAQACQDGTSPKRVASVSISGAPSVTLNVGDSLSLSATTAGEDGLALTGRTVQWSSSAPSVATVDGAGKVKALTPGSAYIRATAEGAADSVSVLVQQASSGCADGGTTLGVGEVRQIDPRGDPAVCLAPGSGEYTLIAFNGVETGSLNLSIQGGIAAFTGVAPLRAGSPGFRFGDVTRPSPDLEFERGLRARERRVLPAYREGIRAMRSSAGPSRSVSAAVPAVGDLIDLNVSLDPCGDIVRRGARVSAVTSRAIVVTDTANPDGGFTDDEARQIGEVFDTLVYPVVTGNFGEPTDIDANERKIIIFYTRAVNELTDEGDEDSYVGGFFYGRDLFPVAECAGSNFGELFYVLAADPAGEVKGNDRSKEFVREVTIATIAHEFQHLINASRRLHVNDAEGFEETWLDEGLAHIAEELVFYRASGLAPKQNLNTEVRSSQSRFDLLVEYQGGNLGRYRTYLEEPEGNSPYQQDDDLETRGASWAFLRYAADRVATDEMSVWNRLANSRVTGFANLRAVLGTEPIPLVRDWAVSVFTDDFVATSDIFQQPSWAFRPLFNVVFRNSGGFTLKTRTVGADTQSISLAPGGATYIGIAQSPTARATLRITSGGVAPPNTLSAFLVRTR